MLLIHFGQKNLVVHKMAELLFCFIGIAEIEDVINKKNSENTSILYYKIILNSIIFGEKI